jgi:hypothetical protein
MQLEIPILNVSDDDDMSSVGKKLKYHASLLELSIIVILIYYQTQLPTPN